jgi:phosphatidylglycerophosphate synthase
VKLNSTAAIIMSKLPEEYRFIDLSDYGRGLAHWIADSIKSTSLTPIHVTIGFILSGLLAIACIVEEHFWWAAFFLIFKSVLDAADGELARIKNTPSYTGRYFDSVADIILNFLFLFTIAYMTDTSVWLTLLAFVGMQLQGTLYNYYYVILRNRFNGDTTSRIFEEKIPVAMAGESQRSVNIFFRLFKFLYGAFDKTIFWMDQQAPKARQFPKWFMTAVSALGLGFQLLIMALMLVLGWIDYIIPFFVGYSGFILVFIAIRRMINV